MYLYFGGDNVKVIDELLQELRNVEDQIIQLEDYREEIYNRLDKEMGVE
jgi:flagellar biosynthesis chaperone FliJ